ncbi:MAG: hypothetical protein RLZZ387_4075 [Chloroflexota bacterium]|jgi:hypothetical protein
MNHSSNAAVAFRELVQRHSCHGDGRDRLTNVTFFTGAGFSKAWDVRSPTGNELFTFTKEFLQSAECEIDELLTLPGYPTLEDTAPARFKELIYNLHMQLKYPGIRTRYMDDASINLAIAEIKALVQKRFEELIPLNVFDPAQGVFTTPGSLTGVQEGIVEFFRWLSAQQEGSRGYARGVHTDFISTNYDYIIETILDRIFPPGSALQHTYRGITPAKICGNHNKNIVQSHWSVTSLIKINGGFEVIPVEGGYHIDYRARRFGEVRSTPPELMMPSKEQNYTSHYFSSVFPKTVRLLQESSVLVIVGYSLSEEDALLRYLIRQFAEDLRDIDDKYIFYIGNSDPEYLLERLQSCFRYVNHMDRSHIYTHSGGLIDWISQVMEQ